MLRSRPSRLRLAAFRVLLKVALDITFSVRGDYALREARETIKYMVFSLFGTLLFR